MGKWFKNTSSVKSIGNKAFSNLNIDEYMDALIDAQRNHGIKPTMVEAMFDPSTGRRINKFERARLEKSGVDLSNYVNGKSSCSGNCNKCNEKQLSNIERGVFVLTRNDLPYEEDDQPYICDYCLEIGYDGKYQPDKCDFCNQCDDCVDSMNGKCMGCMYSTFYNNGLTYAEVNEDVETSYNAEDELLVNDISENAPEYEIRKPLSGFTVMDY